MDILDFGLLAQNIKVTNWLTPIWLISLGVAAGFVLAILLMIKIWIGQRIPFFNTVVENRGLYIGFGTVTTLVYLGLVLAGLYWSGGPAIINQDLFWSILFVLPFCALIGFGAWKLTSKRMIGEMSSLFFEGFLGWVNIICLVFTVFAVGGFVLAQFNGFGVIKFVDKPMEFVQSLQRWPYTGTFAADGENVHRFRADPIVVQPSPKSDDGSPFDGYEVPVYIDGTELSTMFLKSDQKVEVCSRPITTVPNANLIIEILPKEEPYFYRQRKDGRGLFPADFIEVLYVRNQGRTPANLELSWVTTPTYPEVGAIPVVMAMTLAIYVFYMVLAVLFPKTHSIAHATFKTEIGQPLFPLVIGLGILFIMGTIYVPYNTFGEDIKMYKDSGLTLIRVLAIFFAIWAASKSVAEEIEGRTALTVLSKPVGRRQFILGKFGGISLAISVVFLILGSWFILWTAYKQIYDYQEASKGLCEWDVCFREAIHIAPGLFLCLLEVLVFVAISVAISTRMGILANFLICFSIYVLGHLTPLLVQSSLTAFEPVVVFGQLVAIVFPVLDHYDVQAAISSNSMVPTAYIGWSLTYTVLYGALALLVALVFFEDRDLA